MIFTRKCIALAAAIVALSGGTASAALVGEFLFENNTNDTSPFGRNGTAVNGPTFVTGLYLGSTSAIQMNTDGVNMAMQARAQAITLPANESFITNAPGATLMAWVRLDGGTSNRSIISINNGGTGEGAARATLQIIDSGGSAQVRALGRKDDTGNASSATSGSTFLTIGQTYFLTGVFDYLNSGIRVYINGVQVGTATPGWGTNSANSANKFSEIGSVATPAASNQEYWPGLIDGARIFNTALTAEQILDLYNNPDSIPDENVAGDTDGDGIVELSDLSPIRQNYLQNVSDRLMGDLVDDNIVDFRDFRQWKTAWLEANSGSGSLAGVDFSFLTPVPEPSAVLLAALSLCGFIGRRRSRS
jgi:hypothetical protein